MKVDRPPEFHSVTPRMVVSDAAGAVEFLRTVFDAAGEVQTERPTEVRIGDSVVMVTSATEREPFPAFSTCTSAMRTWPTTGPSTREQ